MATATKNKPVVRRGSEPAAIKRAKHAPWTKKEVATLKASVAAAPTAAAGIREAAKLLGKKEGAVNQKWYKLKETKKGKTPKAAAKTAKPVLAPTPAPVQSDWMQKHVDLIDSKIVALQEERTSFTVVMRYRPKNA